MQKLPLTLTDESLSIMVMGASNATICDDAERMDWSMVEVTEGKAVIESR